MTVSRVQRYGETPEFDFCIRRQPFAMGLVDRAPGISFTLKWMVLTRRSTRSGRPPFVNHFHMDCGMSTGEETLFFNGEVLCWSAVVVDSSTIMFALLSGRCADFNLLRRDDWRGGGGTQLRGNFFKAVMAADDSYL